MEALSVFIAGLIAEYQLTIADEKKILQKLRKKSVIAENFKGYIKGVEKGLKDLKKISNILAKKH